MSPSYELTSANCTPRSRHTHMVEASAPENNYYRYTYLAGLISND
jgi:hypothetical protein